MLSAVGRIVAGVDDQEAALAFYRDVLGFEVLHDSDAGGFRYLHVGLAAHDGVGLWLFPRPEGERPLERPLIVLYTDTLDGVLERLSAAAVDVWNVRDDGASRSAHFRDVAGNVLIVAELRQ
jgi:catechol 2,3-dioxygenase-like lactoylglutathione lyase family enzyme